MVGNGLVAARSHGEPTPSRPPTGNSGLQFAVVAHNERQLAIYTINLHLTRALWQPVFVNVLQLLGFSL
jgi:hypothetical protein